MQSLPHRVTTTTDMSGFQDVDVVIEAVFEDLGLKKKVLADAEGAGKEDVIFASNTSSLPITQIAEGAKRPEDVMRRHYFSPGEKMPRAQRMGVVRRSGRFHREAIQLKTLTPEGTVMRVVVTAKADPRNGLMPDTNMWCPQTRKLIPEMNAIATTIDL